MLRQQQSERSGFLSILFAQGEEPLVYWDKQVRSGRIKRVVDENEKSKLQAIEILGSNVLSTFISTPTSDHTNLGITLPVLVLIVKNLKRYFFYQVQIRDDKNFRRRFRMTNIPGFNRRQPTVCTFPITMEDGWNELAANLAELTQRVYGTQYVETIRLEIHPNCRLREVFFCEKMDAMKVRISRPNESTNQLNIPPSSPTHNYGPANFPDSLSPNQNSNSPGIEDENKTSNIMEAVQKITEYDELAKQVKSCTNSNTGSPIARSSNNNNNANNTNSNSDDTNSSSISITASSTRRSRTAQQGMKEKNSTKDKTNRDSMRTRDTSKEGQRKSSESSSLSLGERLKRDMYFEKPKTTDKNQDKHRKSSK